MQNERHDLSGFNDEPSDATIHMIGDKTLLCQVVLLLSYIRNAIKSNTQADIQVKVGSKVANGQLMFDVNGLEIPDMIV